MMMSRLLPLLLTLLWPSAACAHDWNGIARDAKGNLYVVDAEDGQIWKIDAQGEVSVFLSGKEAKRCNHPHHLAIDAKGALWLPSG